MGKPRKRKTASARKRTVASAHSQPALPAPPAPPATNQKVESPLERIERTLAEAQEVPNPFAVLEALGGWTMPDVRNALATGAPPVVRAALNDDVQQELELELADLCLEASQTGFKAGQQSEQQRTAKRKQRILELRNAGRSYGEIALDLSNEYPGLTENNVKQICHRAKNKKSKK